MGLSHKSGRVVLASFSHAHPRSHSNQAFLIKQQGQIPPEDAFFAKASACQDTKSSRVFVTTSEFLLLEVA